MSKQPDTAKERLAAYAHDAWGGWMKYLFSKGTFNDDGTWTMPAWAVERWQRQMNTPYAELPEEEKESDREEAEKIIKVLLDFFMDCRGALIDGLIGKAESDDKEGN